MCFNREVVPRNSRSPRLCHTYNISEREVAQSGSAYIESILCHIYSYLSVYHQVVLVQSFDLNRLPNHTVVGYFVVTSQTSEKLSTTRGFQFTVSHVVLATQHALCLQNCSELLYLELIHSPVTRPTYVIRHSFIFIRQFS